MLVYVSTNLHYVSMLVIPVPVIAGVAALYFVAHRLVQVC
jgi:hypothetical protein